MPGKMTKEQALEFIDGCPGWAVLSTLGADGTPHTVPLGYFRVDEEIFMGVRDRTTKVANIDRDARVSVLFESGSTMAELRGVMLQGRARVHRDPEEVLDCSRNGAKARGVPESDWPTEARPGVAYIRVTPERIISWDYGRDA